LPLIEYGSSNNLKIPVPIQLVTGNVPCRPCPRAGSFIQERAGSGEEQWKNSEHNDTQKACTG